MGKYKLYLKINLLLIIIISTTYCVYLMKNSNKVSNLDIFVDNYYTFDNQSYAQGYILKNTETENAYLRVKLIDVEYISEGHTIVTDKNSKVIYLEKINYNVNPNDIVIEWLDNKTIRIQEDEINIKVLYIKYTIFFVFVALFVIVNLVMVISPKKCIKIVIKPKSTLTDEDMSFLSLYVRLLGLIFAMVGFIFLKK